MTTVFTEAEIEFYSAQARIAWAQHDALLADPWLPEHVRQDLAEQHKFNAQTYEHRVRKIRAILGNARQSQTMNATSKPNV